MTLSNMLNLSKSVKFAAAFFALSSLQAQAAPFQSAINFVSNNKTLVAVSTTAAVSIAACTIYNNPEASKEFYANFIEPTLKDIKPHFAEIFSPVTNILPQGAAWALAEGSAAKIFAKNFVAEHASAFSQQASNITKNILLETMKNPKAFISLTQSLLK